MWSKLGRLREKGLKAGRKVLPSHVKSWVSLGSENFFFENVKIVLSAYQKSDASVELGLRLAVMISRPEPDDPLLDLELSEKRLTMTGFLRSSDVSSQAKSVTTEVDIVLF